MAGFVGQPAVGRVRAQSLRPSGRPGSDVAGLHIGEPDLPTPDFVVDALDEAVRAGFTHYAHPQGDPELREAVADRLSGTSVRSHAASEVLITAGGSAGLASAISAIVGPGDRVVVPEPTYSLYHDITRFVGGELVEVAPLPGMRLDLGRLEEEMSSARLVILCHPVNPTGIVYRRDELEAVGELADRHGTLVLVDEAYDQLVYDGREFTSSLEIARLAEHLVYCQTFSKSYAMTGWRLGYLAGPREVVDAAALVHRTYHGSVNAAVQRAGLAAVADHQRWPRQCLETYQKRRDRVIDALRNEPGVELVAPEGAFYAFVGYGSTLPATEVVAMGLARKVGLRAGTEFGRSGEGYIRVSYSVPDDTLDLGLERLIALLADVRDAASST